MGYIKGEINKRTSRVKMNNTSKYKEEKVEDILKLPALEIPERGISRKTAAHFGIRTAVDPRDGRTHIAHYFPYTVEGKIVGFKKRDLTKPKVSSEHFSAVGFQGVQCELFGQAVANKTGGKKVIICEGEYDAAITWQILKERNTKINPSVLSIGNGTGNAVQNIGQKANMRYISKFQEVILAFDADKATPSEKEKKIMKGKDAVAAIYGLLPEIKVADFPEDYDPCDMYREGLIDQLYWSVMKPIEYKPEGFRMYDSFKDKAHELPKLGRSWPWPSMTKATLGRRDGEGYYFGSGVKMG